MKTKKNRGKDYSTNEWVYGVLDSSYRISNILIDIDTLGEFTDVLDKNGKEIYEGDILRCHYAGIEIVGYIEYYDGAYWVIGKSEEPLLVNVSDAEIIGNLYDNPELLKD